MKDERKMRAEVCRDFERITKLWKLRDNERLRILGLNSINRFHAFCCGTVPISEDAYFRILCIIQIHSALRVLVPGNDSGWVHRPNSAKIFKGKPALELLLSGDSGKIKLVRDYLMGEMQGHYL